MSRRIFLIKAFHTLVFFFMVGCLVYIMYAVIADDLGLLLLLAVAAVFMEGLALILNGWRCPLTTLTEKYGTGNGGITDMFLPDIIARNTFRIGIIVFVVELLLLAWRYLT